MNLDLKRNILLNPGPGTTNDIVKQAMIVSDICPREKEFCDLMNSIKKDLLKVLNAGKEYTSVLFSSSGTGGVEATLTSAVPKDGKILIIENGAYGTRMRNIVERYNIRFISYSLCYGDYPDIKEIESILKSNYDITHIAVVDHETTTGMRNPVDVICQLAHSHNVEVIVDCMSSFAGLQINIEEWRAEYIISSSNKCIQGMPGLAFIVFRKNLLEKIKNNARSYYFDLYAQHIGFFNSGQMQFTPPVQVVYALRTALDILFCETVEKRINRYRENYELLYSGLKQYGFKFLLPDMYQSGILLAVKEPLNDEYDFNLMHDFFYKNGFTIYPGKGAKEATFRLSVLGDLYIEDIKLFLEFMGLYLQKYGIKKLIY